MAKTHHFKIREQLSEDAAGTVFRAIDQSTGKRVILRKYTQMQSGATGLHAVEEVAYQVAIERLSPICHPSLRHVIAGGADPHDGTPYVATNPLDANPLATVMQDGRLSVELTTKLLLQLLELCELLSHVLAEEGVWVETNPSSIAITGHNHEPRFIFWASPLKCLDAGKGPRDFGALAQLTEILMGWQDKRVDERNGSHLFAWLQWLKSEAPQSRTSIREIREMLAAAAGVEPPPPIESLLAEAQRPRRWLETLPKLPLDKWIRAPKMPLFVILTVMLVIQSIAGWIWVRKINADFDRQLQNQLESIDLSIPEGHYRDDEPESTTIEAVPTSPK